MNAAGYAVMAVAVVAVLGAVAFLPPVSAVLTSATVSTSRTSTGGSATTSATTSTVLTSCTSSTATQVASATVNGTYDVNSSQVRIDYVSASVYIDQIGLRTLRMEVGFTNIGNAAIFVPAGCGSSLNSTITSGSSVVTPVQGVPRCLCAEAMSAVSPGQSRSEVDPGCWSGYYYRVVASGTFSAKLTLNWYPDSQFNGPRGSVIINATFVIA